jgi:SAM-dependent methyltransferase
VSIEEFDEYARDYDGILRESIGFLGKNTDYYSEIKINVLKRNVPGRINSILEYGCGTGRSFKHLRKGFPNARLFGCDVSNESLEIARNNNHDVNFFHAGQEFPEKIGFDIVLLSNVLHHVLPNEREAVMSRACDMVNVGGKVCIIEHNPINPLVKNIVKKCPIDKNAVLLSLHEGCLLVEGLSIITSGYFLLFPASLSCLAWLEPFFSKIPFGGQFYIIAEKNISK